MSYGDIRLGVVGVAGRGGTHAENAAELGAQVVAGADIDPDALARFADRYGAETHEDHEAMLDAENLDAVVVGAPNKFHEPAAVAALERDVPVLVEKPLAHTLASAERVAAAADASSAFCTVGFQNRFLNTAKALKAHVDDGRLGDIVHAEVNFARQRGFPGGGWWLDPEVGGGGALIDLGVHVLDLALYFMDFPEIVEAFGVTRSQFSGREEYAYHWGSAPAEESPVEDSAMAMLRTAEGGTVFCHAAWAHNYEQDMTIAVHGTEAGAGFDRHEDRLTLYETSTAGADQLVDAEATVEENDASQDEMAHFLDGVSAGGVPDTNTVEEGLQVQRVIDAIYRSADAGRSVEL
jgi:predicted dehydrogenase